MRRAERTPAAPPGVASDVHERPTRVPPKGAAVSGMQLRIEKPAPAVVAPPIESAKGAPPERAVLEGRLLRAVQASCNGAALMLASSLAYLDPEDEVARRIKARCAELEESPRAREFPRRKAIPRMHLGWNGVKEEMVSCQAAYMLTFIDGQSTVEVLVDASGLPPLTAYEAIDSLIGAGIVVVE